MSGGAITRSRPTARIGFPMPQKTHTPSVMATVALNRGQWQALELDRRAIAQRRVQPFLVVDLVQKIADAEAGFGQIAIVAAIHLFALQGFQDL
jgi:hypothetical protein